MPMDKKQLQAWKECDLSGCMHMPRCTHYFGNNCIRLQGKRIPKFRILIPEKYFFKKPDIVVPGYRYFMSQTAATRM